MALFRSEYGIGRGEIAESRIEVPLFLFITVISAIALVILHIYVRNNSITLAVGISMLVFALTVVRVELGVYFLAIAMLLSPEIAAGEVGKRQLQLNLRYDDILIIVIFLGVMLKQAFEGRGQFILNSPINAGILCFYSVCLFSTGLAANRGLPLFHWKDAFFVLLKMLEYYLIFILVGTAIRDMAQIKRALQLFFLVAIVISGFGVAQIGIHERVSAPFEQGGTEPNTLGGYLSLVIALALGLWLNAPTKRLKHMFLLLAVIAFLPFLHTLSRASYLALIVSLIVLAIMGRSWLIGITLAVVLAVSPLIMPTPVIERVAYTFQDGGGKEVTVGGMDTGLEVDKSTHERLHVWSKATFNLRIWPWFGGGVSWSMIQDSQYARILIETGLVGMAAFVFLMWRVSRTLREARRWARDWMGRGLALGLTAGHIGLLVHSFGTNTFLIVRIMEPFWFLVALVTVVRQLAIEAHVRQSATLREVKTSLNPIGQPLPST